MAFNMLAGQVIGPLSGVIGLWDQLQQARISAGRLSDVLDDNDPEPQPPPEERVYPKVIRDGRVKFDRVFFHYGTKGARRTYCGTCPSKRAGATHRHRRTQRIGQNDSGPIALGAIPADRRHDHDRRLDSRTDRLGYIAKASRICTARKPVVQRHDFGKHCS